MAAGGTSVIWPMVASLQGAHQREATTFAAKRPPMHVASAACDCVTDDC